MPIRISKNWRPALQSIARIQLAGEHPEFAWVWKTYTKNQRKYVRETVRKIQRPEVMPEKKMWEEKRVRQRADLDALNSGLLSNDDVNWFAGGIAKQAKIIGSVLGCSNIRGR